MCAERLGTASASARPPVRGSSDARGDPDAGQADALVEEHRTVVAGDGQQVGVGVEGAGPGDRDPSVGLAHQPRLRAGWR